MKVSANIPRRDENDRWPEAVARACKSAWRKLEGPLRQVAREHGYALGLHGSLCRDIDLIAAPWTQEASDAETLIAALHKKADEITGWAFFSEADKNPTEKPCGRLAWSIHLARTYLDVSVLPKAA